MFARIFHTSAAPSPQVPPEAPAAPEPAPGHVALHIPLLSDAFHDVERRVGLGSDAGDDAPEARPAGHAVLEVPAHSALGSFFGAPLRGVETVVLDAAHRLLVDAERSCTAFACRWIGALAVLGAGVWAGASLVAGSPSWVNPRGERHPAIGGPLIALSVPLSLVGAYVGGQIGRWACLDLDAPRPRAASV